MLGVRAKYGKASFPNKERSRYSMEKYSFFLQAPFSISDKCCGIMKKAPLHAYQREHHMMPITAQMAEESMLRTQKWLQHGCNAFDSKNPKSNPMSFWTEQDVLQYIYENDLPICSVYGDVVKADEIDGQMDLSDFIEGVDMQCKYRTTGCKRTGCMMCGFGAHLEKEGEGRFEMLKQTHPQMYNLLDACKNNGYTLRQAIEWTNEHGGTNIRL